MRAVEVRVYKSLEERDTGDPEKGTLVGGTPARTPQQLDARVSEAKGPIGYFSTGKALGGYDEALKELGAITDGRGRVLWWQNTADL